MARNLTDTLGKLAAAGKLDGIANDKPASSGADTLIDVSLIEPDPEQPRRTFDKDKLQSLSDNVKVHGVLQAITVQPVNEDGKHLIIMGERRWRAAKLAGMKAIPAKIREATSELRAIQITENVQREDLSTMEIALAVEQMRKDGLSRPAIAESLGWAQSTISRFSGVVKMPDELQELARLNVPVLALADLHAQWKKDESAVRDFINATPAEDITRVTVASLRAEIEAGQGASSSKTHPETESPENKPTNLTAGLAALSGENEPSKPQDRPKPTNGQVAILCQQGNQIGRILTDRKARSSKAIMVSFENGERVEEIPLTDIVLFEVVEL